MSEPGKNSILGEGLRTELKELVREVVREELADGNRQGGEDHLVDAEEAAKLLSVSPDWFYKNWRKLPFAVKLHHKMLRFSSVGIQRYIAAKKLKGGS
jgi:predicted DNA-binding transcriptional regulator AlpA